MAGDRDCYGVCRAGSGNGSNSSWHAYLFCHGAVGTRFSPGNSLQAFPDPPLKSGGANIERQRGIRLLSVDEACEVLSPLRHGGIVAAANRERKLPHQALHELLLGVAE